MYPETTGVIKVELERLRREGVYKQEAVGTPKERRFYLLLKIHKLKDSWPFPDGGRSCRTVVARAMG